MNFTAGIEINRIANDEDVNLFEAAILFCERNDIDVEDLLPELDPTTVAALTVSAIDAKLVRRCVANRVRRIGGL